MERFELEGATKDHLVQPASLFPWFLILCYIFYMEQSTGKKLLYIPLFNHPSFAHIESSGALELPYLPTQSVWGRYIVFFPSESNSLPQSLHLHTYYGPGNSSCKSHRLLSYYKLY